MNCPRCEAKNPADAIYCYNCGLRLEQTLPASQTLPNQPPALWPTPPPPAFGTFPPSFSPHVYQPTPVYATPAPFFQGTPIRAEDPVARFHPLAEGVVGLPREVERLPKTYYSYVDPQKRLVFVQRASLWQRIGAGLLDLVVLFIPYMCVSSLFVGALSGGRVFTDTGSSSSYTNDPTSSGWILLLTMVIGFGYFYLTGVSSGQSLGKRVLKIRVVRLDGEKPDQMTALLRFVVGYMLSTNILLLGILVSFVSLLSDNNTLSIIIGLVTFGWGFWWCGLDERRQSWHDKLARTLVVNTQPLIEGVNFSRDALG